MAWRLLQASHFWGFGSTIRPHPHLQPPHNRWAPQSDGRASKSSSLLVDAIEVMFPGLTNPVTHSYASLGTHPPPNFFQTHSATCLHYYWVSSLHRFRHLMLRKHFYHICITFKLFQLSIFGAPMLIWHTVMYWVSLLWDSPSGSWSFYASTLYMHPLYLTFSIPIIAIPFYAYPPPTFLVFSPAPSASFDSLSSSAYVSHHSVSFFQADPICLILSFRDLSPSKSSNLGVEPYFGCFLGVGSDLTFRIISCLLGLLVSRQIGHCYLN